MVEANPGLSARYCEVSNFCCDFRLSKFRSKLSVPAFSPPSLENSNKAGHPASGFWNCADTNNIIILNKRQYRRQKVSQEILWHTISDN